MPSETLRFVGRPKLRLPISKAQPTMAAYFPNVYKHGRKTPEEEALCKEAMECCQVEAIGTLGA